MSQRVVATRLEVIAVHKLLEQHLHKGDGDLWFYDHGWDDQQVADQVAKGRLKASHVGSIRSDFFGNLRNYTTGGGGDAALKTRVEKLEARVGQLETVVGNLVTELASTQDLHQKLCMTLSVNRVYDVRHLAGKPRQIAQAAE